MNYEYFGSPECADVAAMHEKFGLTLNHEPTDLRPEQLRQRHRFLVEEVNEMGDAIEAGNIPEVIDALVDIVVVALGTAVMMGIKWSLHWREVRRANMSKVRGPDSRRRGQDLLKPEGWQKPDHQKVLDTYAKR